MRAGTSCRQTVAPCAEASPSTNAMTPARNDRTCALHFQPVTHARISTKPPQPASPPHDVLVVGGCGHVGLPLALAFADRGMRSVSYDINEVAVKTVGDGQLPFREDGAEEVLQR